MPIIVEYEETTDRRGDDHPANYASRAFPFPTANTIYKWHGRTQLQPGWRPYLIQITKLDEPELTFHFIGRDGRARVAEWRVNLDEQRLVWRQLPSSLAEYEPGTRDCAFLFLSKDLETLNRAMYEDGKAGAGGGTGKWPRGAGVSPIEAALPAIAKILKEHRNALSEADARALENLQLEGSSL